MGIDLSGIWDIELHADSGVQSGKITVPGILQAQGYGNDIGLDTPWVSGLHDEAWFEREEQAFSQKIGDKQINVPFLAQPPKHFLGKALYWREFEIAGVDGTGQNDTTEWYLYIELVRWRTRVFVDGAETGGDCSLCTPHVIPCGRLSAGRHTLAVEVDNSMQYPYRPDGHGVSDALGATWNGMAGEVALLTEEELMTRGAAAKAYAREHPRHIEVRRGMFYVDGRPEYFRGTHFGGDYPLTGYPETDRAWWDRLCRTLKDWGLNFIRCHSCCPPEAAFAAADEAGIYIQPECGMWNHFEAGIPMLAVLKSETQRILKQFGHHPSFVLFSPTNEPSGDWYQPLREWVADTREFDKSLGYEGRRLYTAQSGWFYDVPPSEVMGTDYLFFHRSAYGPYNGGMIRNQEGWHGGDYSPSLAGAQLPVICHEMGQWCAYPDFDVTEKFTGYLQPSNYRVFREQCERQGLLGLNHAFAYASGRNQLRLYKEDIEANLRTKELYGFEMLDLHDYLGQGTALVGLLDAFWESKGYVEPWEFRQFCGSTVLLARFSSYVFTGGGAPSENPSVPVEICHFGAENYDNCVTKWRLEEIGTDWSESGEVFVETVMTGRNTPVGSVVLPLHQLHRNSRLLFSLSLFYDGDKVCDNSWELYVYCDTEGGGHHGVRHSGWHAMPTTMPEVLYTRVWREAKNALLKGKRVVYSPRLSDLSYECPPVSMKNVFWNAQMGPTWGRSLGLLIDEDFPAFREFPTDRTGGWQWDEILRYARAFDIIGFGADMEPAVRVIDDWNRNLPLALIFEAEAENGRLLVVSADLDFGQEQNARPAAKALKAALMHYAASADFSPKTKIRAEDMEKRLFPVYRMEQLVKTIVYPQNALVENGVQLITADPEKAVAVTAQDFPIKIVLTLNRSIAVRGLLYVPDQRARKRRGFVKEYALRVREEGTGEWRMAAEGTLQNSSLSQEIHMEQVRTEQLEFAVLSVYGDTNWSEWAETADGYYQVQKYATANVRIGGLHLLCDEPAVYEEVYPALTGAGRRKKCVSKTEIED